MSEVEHELLAAIAAAPADVTARQVYADWLIARGDERGELMSLDLAERAGHELTDLQPLLRLAAVHGFPRWPDDPDDELLPFAHTQVAEQFHVHHRGVDYYISYRRGVLSIITNVDWVRHDFPALDLKNLDAWDAHQTDVFLSIISRTLRLEHELTLIEWPRRGALEELDRMTRKRRAHYHLGLGVMAPGRPAHPEPRLGVIDYERWGLLWERWDRARRR